MRPPIVAILLVCVQFNGVFLQTQSRSSQLNKNESWKTLYEAIEIGNENEFKTLLSGVNSNAMDQHRNTALLLAAIKESLHNSVDVEKLAALENIVQILIENGVNINATDDSGNSILILATANGKGDISILKLLIDNGANLNAVNNDGQSALIKAISKKHENGAVWLIKNGANPNVGSHNNDSALILAISKQYEKITQLLVQKGADVNAVGAQGFTPLMRSTSLGNEKIARVLIEMGANVNATNDDGDSALHLAARNKNSRCAKFCKEYKEVLQLLIDKGANVNIVNRNNHTALDAAFESNESEEREEVVRLLTQHGAVRRAALFYRKTAVDACRLYSNLTFAWNYGFRTRISDGSQVESGEFPWAVALGYLDRKYKISFSCGGSLISDIFVLTAAHCVRDNRPAIVRLGKVSLSDEDGTRTENQNIKEIISHPKYSFVTKKNDIALIRLVDRLYITKSIQPVCLQTLLKDEQPHENLTVARWGKTGTDGTSVKLLKAHLKTMPLTGCNETFWKYNKKQNLPELRLGIDQSQYCAHDPSEASDSCPGDSGGPLQTTQTHSNPVKLVGIVSYGIACGNSSSLPGIYTRVAHYIDWIGAHVWPNGEIPTPRVYISDDEFDGSEEYIISSK